MECRRERPLEREQLLSKALHLLPEPVYLSDEKQYTKKRFPASFLPFPYCRARRGRGSREDLLPPPASPDLSSVRACSLPCVTYVHVRVHVCRKFRAWSCTDITGAVQP